MINEQWSKIYQTQLSQNTIAETICKVDFGKKVKISIFMKFIYKIRYIKWRISDFIKYVFNYK